MEATVIPINTRSATGGWVVEETGSEGQATPVRNVQPRLHTTGLGLRRLDLHAVSSLANSAAARAHWGVPGAGGLLLAGAYAPCDTTATPMI